MEIVHLTATHHWDDPRIFHKMCRSLAKAGHDVHLVAPRCDGPEIETRHGVRVHAVPPAQNRWQRLGRTSSWILKRLARLNADIYHFHDPELTPLGLRLKAAGKRVVYDAHEDLPKHVLIREWIPTFLRKAASRGASIGEAIAARLLDGIVAATPLIARRFPQHKTVTVQNFPIPEEIEAPGRLPVSKRSPVVAYAGTITHLRGARAMVSAMALLPKSPPSRLSLAGKIVPAALEHQLRQGAGWDRVDYHGWCDRQGIAGLLAQASVGLVTFLPTPNHVEAQPVKLFEYMCAGLPIVASDFPVWREFVEGAGCGLLVDPEDPQTIAEAIRWLLTHPAEAERMGRRGRTAVAERLNWQREFQVLSDFYHRLLGGACQNGPHGALAGRGTSRISGR